MSKRIHFQPSWCVQQILSRPKKLILPIEGSASTCYTNSLSYTKKWNRPLVVKHCLCLFDRVAINESIYTQQHITTLQNILPTMLTHEKNGRW